ncbi:hypothetical protein D9M70_348820 [compost metagenome]
MAESAGHLQTQARAFGAERGEQRHHALAGEVLGQAQAQHALAVLGAQRFAGFLAELQDAPRIAEQPFAGLGGQDLPLAAVEQAATEVLLQAQDLLADGGLGEVQVLGGAGEVAGVHHHDKAAQQGWVEHSDSH